MSDEASTTEIFTQEVFRKVVGSKGKLLSWKPHQLDSSSGLLSTLNKSYHHPVGHFGFEVTYSPNDGGPAKTIATVIKSKVTGATVEDTFNACGQMCGPPMSTVHEKYKRRTAFSFCHIRELEIYGIRDPRFTSIVPEIFCVYADKEKDIYLIAMEKLDSEHFTCMNRIDDAPEVWKDEEIKVALRDIAGFHSIYLGKVDSLLNKSWMESYTLQTRVELTELWSEFVDNSRRRLPELWSENRHRIVKNIIANLRHIWSVFESSPRTLIHNDLTPRNMCIRTKTSTGEKTRRLCVYDWECAAVHVPQYDLAEFFAFTLPPDSDPSVREELVEFYRQELEKQSGMQFEKEQFLKVFYLACCDFSVYRAACLSMLPDPRAMKCLPRTMHSHLGYLEHLYKAGHLHFITNP